VFGVSGEFSEFEGFGREESPGTGVEIDARTVVERGRHHRKTAKVETVRLEIVEFA